MVAFHGLALQRVPQRLVRKIAGHASLSVTVKVYAKDEQNLFKRALCEMGGTGLEPVTPSSSSVRGLAGSRH